MEFKRAPGAKIGAFDKTKRTSELYVTCVRNVIQKHSNFAGVASDSGGVVIQRNVEMTTAVRMINVSQFSQRVAQNRSEMSLCHQCADVQSVEWCWNMFQPASTCFVHASTNSAFPAWNQNQQQEYGSAVTMEMNVASHPGKLRYLVTRTYLSRLHENHFTKSITFNFWYDASLVNCM